MKNRNIAKLFAFFLAVFFCLVPVEIKTAAESGKEDPVIVIAGSDFQEADLDASLSGVNKLFKTIKNNGYDKIDGFLFCGDYSRDHGNMDDEISALKNAVKAEFGNPDMVFLKGNHDSASTKGLSKSGANDTDDYGVFVINESDYMWYNKYPGPVKNIAEKLEKYLSEKNESGYTKPIFVASHLSLAYSKRTYNDGDGRYAKYIFDILNKYGETLNIIFLYGHNHNNRYDDYVGGSQVYLTKGDEIFISDPDDQKAVPAKHTLNFTYLNAGYVGSAYCLNENVSMTVFEITDTAVIVKRYGETKQIPLKTKGSWASSLGEDAAFYGAEDDYLLTEYTGSDYIGLGAYDNGVTVISQKVTGVTVGVKTENPVTDLYTAYASYTLEGKGYTDGEKVLVKILLPEGFTSEGMVFVEREWADAPVAVVYESGRAVFEANSLGSHKIYQTKEYSVGKGVSAYCAVPSGTVQKSKNASEQTVGTVYLVSGGKQSETVEITVSMLKDKDGNEISLKSGTYKGLSVYQGEKLIYEGFDLTVTSAEGGTLLIVLIICGAVAVAVATAVVIVIKKKRIKRKF